MDKKKLIGTIIGVIMFAILIVGATYAWLSFTATVTNATANGTTLKYTVNYEKGTDISELPILVTPTLTLATEEGEEDTTNTSVIILTAQRPEGSIADNITIYLTSTEDNILTTSGAVKYVICETTCNENFSNNTINSVTAASTVSIFTGTLSGETESDSNQTHTYKIYFWLDAATLTNDHIGKSYSGYIHADSTQNPTNYG